MGRWADGHFDPVVFQAFARRLDIYPVGSLVRVTCGRIGVVVAPLPNSLTTQRVKVFLSSRPRLRDPPENVDLSVRGCREKISAREDPAKWSFPDLNELWSGPLQPR